MFLEKNDTKIKRNTEVTLLEIEIDQDLNLESHIENIFWIGKYRRNILR